MQASRDRPSKLEKTGDGALLVLWAGVFITAGLCVMGYRGARVGASRVCATLSNNTIGRFSDKRYEPARIDSPDDYFLEAGDDSDNYIVPGRIVKRGSEGDRAQPL